MPDSDLARQLVRDPLVFDHLALSGPVAERDLEDQHKPHNDEAAASGGPTKTWVNPQRVLA